jgi:membrane carboxypeptidase/penicillin-binding protein
VGSTYGTQGITVAVRIGFDDDRPLGQRETGARTALPIFREIMLRVYQDKLLGSVPSFPREIEDGIDQYLAKQDMPLVSRASRPGSSRGTPSGAKPAP